MTEQSGTGIRSRIDAALGDAVRSLGVEGAPPDLELGRAKGADHGEYASPAGLKLAGVLQGLRRRSRRRSRKPSWYPTARRPPRRPAATSISASHLSGCSAWSPKEP